MQTFGNQAAQGDIFIRRINALPPGLTRSEPINGRHVIAHSETGHDHYMEMMGVEFWQDPRDPMVAYLSVGVSALLEHARPFDTHESICFDSGIYEIRRQREYTPAGWRRVED